MRDYKDSTAKKIRFAEFGKYKVHYRKLIDEFLLIEIEDSGILKVKLNKDFVEVEVYTSESLTKVSGIKMEHEKLK